CPVSRSGSSRIPRATRSGSSKHRPPDGTIVPMRRADRLFQIVNLLRRRRTATTAAHLAERLGVSERTVYRDIRDLILASTPIDGEAGVGYRVRPGYELPPL